MPTSIPPVHGFTLPSSGFCGLLPRRDIGGSEVTFLRWPPDSNASPATPTDAVHGGRAWRRTGGAEERWREPPARATNQVPWSRRRQTSPGERERPRPVESRRRTTARASARKSRNSIDMSGTRTARHPIPERHVDHPSRRTRERARSSMPGLRSTPTIAPVGPIARSSRAKFAPVPHPISTTVSPGSAGGLRSRRAGSRSGGTRSAHTRRRDVVARRALAIEIPALVLSQRLGAHVACLRSFTRASTPSPGRSCRAVRIRVRKIRPPVDSANR